jgi:hypothetical protein
MVMRIWKNQISIGGTCTVPVPKGSKLLSIQVQNSLPVAWFEVPHTGRDPGFDDYVFVGVLTGQETKEPKYPYISTLQFHDGNFVVHYYAGRREP